MPLDLITYGDKTDLNAVTEILKQVAAADMNEIKAVVNAAVNALNSAVAGEQYVFTVDLPSGASVAARIAAAVEGTDYPTGWVLSVGSSALDLVITHNLTRRVGSVTVFLTPSGTIQQQLTGTSAYSAIYTDDAQSCRIASLATVLKPISIYLVITKPN